MALSIRANLPGLAKGSSPSRTSLVRAVRMPAPRAATLIRRSHAAGYESDAEVLDMYANDQLTHSVTGEYDMGIFFLLCGGIFVLPIIFPGSILIVSSIFESMGQ